MVIFDADEKGRGNNSFNSATQKLEDIMKSNNLNFNYYLWPNHNDDGEIEDLIRKLVLTEREQIMNCIENHHKCLDQSGFTDLRQHDKKDFLRFYTYANNIQRTEPRYADYKDSRLWNLNPNEIPEIENLKKFLDPYFQDH